jgi:hypothetical protein
LYHSTELPENLTRRGGTHQATSTFGSLLQAIHSSRFNSRNIEPDNLSSDNRLDLTLHH